MIFRIKYVENHFTDFYVSYWYVPFHSIEIFFNHLFHGPFVHSSKYFLAHCC